MSPARTIAESMKAVVVHHSASPLMLVDVKTPVPQPGQVLVRVEATTVISSELATRAGVSTAQLPLILGNEFVGTVVAAPGSEERLGQRVMGGYQGYGYTKNGAWAEFILTEAADAFPIQSSLESSTLAALPASFTAAAGSLYSLGGPDYANLKGRTLLIRGGTSGVGLAAATLALAAGAVVLSTTRNLDKVPHLLKHGTIPLLDDDSLSYRVRKLTAGSGAHFAIDLLGVASLCRTIECMRPFGTVCLTGLLDDQATSRRKGEKEDRREHVYPHPMELAPPTIRLTSGGVAGTPRTAAMVQEWVTGLENGTYKMPIDSVFPFEDIVEACARRAATEAFGKIVLVV